MIRKSLVSALFGKTRQRVLGLLYGHPDEAYYVRQILREVGMGQGTVQRELRQLRGAGIIRQIRRGKGVYYQADPQCPIFGELQGIIHKTTGLVRVLQKALSPLGKKVKVAFVYGSLARGQATGPSDVDLMVIGSCRFEHVVAEMRKAQPKIRREINPTVYTENEWRTKLAQGHHFTSTVNRNEKLFIKGTADDLEGLARRGAN